MNIHKGIGHVQKEDGNFSQNVLNNATNVLFTYQVPNKQTFILRKFGNYCSLVAAWAGTAVWRIQRNGIGIYPYDTINDQLGTSMEPREIKPLFFEGGDVLTIDATNTSGAAIDMGIAISWEVMDNS